MPPVTSAPWPAPMGDAIRVGVVGDFLDLVAEQTEADPAAIVVDLLVRIGSAAHRGPHFSVSGDRHHANLFALIVGSTGQGRKGSSAAFPRRLLEFADPTWSANCVKSGLSSGEGIVHAVRDDTPTGKIGKDGQEIIEPGVADKRLLAVEAEFSRTMRAASRRESTLGSILRSAWDGAPTLAAITKQPYCATNAHVSLIAHCTPIEFRALLSDTDVSGGSYNRFLFVASRRQRQLPFGGNAVDAALERMGSRLREYLDTARRFAGEYLFTAAARAEWPPIYGTLQSDEQAPGILGELLARGTAQVRRLAMIFAILDGARQVDVPHVAAALEVWRYSRATVGYLFNTTTGNRIADRILVELMGTGAGLSRTAISDLFDRHAPAAEIETALELLRSLGKVRCVSARTGDRGRPSEVWHAIGAEAA